MGKYVKVYINIFLDYLYAVYLDMHRQNYFTKEKLEKIKAIEKEAYPREMYTYQECTTTKNFLLECGCLKQGQLFLLIEDDWYVVAVKHFNCVEVVDFAARQKGKANIMRIVEWLFDNFERSKVIIDCREKTSYRIAKILEKQKKIVILKDKPYIRNSEMFHELEIVNYEY